MLLNQRHSRLPILPILGAVFSTTGCGAVLDIRPPTFEAKAGITLGNSSRKAPPAPNFSEVRLQDFVIEASDGNVEICVWDNKCEDGDVVRVGVADESYEVKLLNEKMCRQFSLGAGTHTIDLYAVNGTGFEGPCSYADKNSGAITVGPVSQPGQQQTWVHRGGTGSSARIHVSLR